jgi:hypothetical protein
LNKIVATAFGVREYQEAQDFLNIGAADYLKDCIFVMMTTRAQRNHPSKSYVLYNSYLVP